MRCVQIHRQLNLECAVEHRAVDSFFLVVSEWKLCTVNNAIQLFHLFSTTNQSHLKFSTFVARQPATRLWLVYTQIIGIQKIKNELARTRTCTERRMHTMQSTCPRRHIDHRHISLHRNHSGKIQCNANEKWQLIKYAPNASFPFAPTELLNHEILWKQQTLYVHAVNFKLICLVESLVAGSS